MAWINKLINGKYEVLDQWGKRIFEVFPTYQAARKFCIEWDYDIAPDGDYPVAPMMGCMD